MADLEDLLERALKARGPDHLARIWRRARPGFTRELRMKDRGALGHMIRACGGDAPRAARALAHAAIRWEEFRVMAEVSDGARQGPGEPHLGFILEHFEVAVALAEEPEEQPASEPQTRDRATQLVVELDAKAREDYIRFLEEN